MQDFALLVEHWSAKDRQKVPEEIDKEQSAEGMIEFLYLALNEHGCDAEQIIDADTVDRALTFRRALCRGIREGKSYFGDVPDTVLIDSNTELFEVPSEGEIQRAIDTDQWRDANDHVMNAINAPNDDIEQDIAAKNHHIDLHLAIERELYTRRDQSSVGMKRHDTLARPTGLWEKNKRGR